MRMPKKPADTLSLVFPKPGHHGPPENSTICRLDLHGLSGLRGRAPVQVFFRVCRWHWFRAATVKIRKTGPF
jgi:hypothetical protein